MKNEINTLTSYFLTAAILVTAHLLSCHATPSRKLLPLGREVKTRGARGGGRVLLRIATGLTMFGLQFQKSY